MTDPSQVPGRPDGAPAALPRHTTPTWEVELLISGVAVFAMLQLPGLFDDLLFALRPRFEPAWHDPLRMVYMYLKSAAVILAATFAIHLTLRAHWIALVGMHSIYPGGVRWDGLKLGPVQRAFELERNGDTATTIDRADNRATTVFALGVALGTLLMAVTLLIGLFFAACWAVILAAGLDVDISGVFLACIVLAVVPFSLAVSADRHFGARLRPGGLRHRLLRGLFGFYAWFGMGRGNVVAFLSSHSGERRTIAVVFLIFLPVMVGVMLGVRPLQSPERFGSYAGFPELDDAGALAVADAHYDRRRDPARDPAVPYVDDLVVIGPYLRLTVPFRPGQDDRALRARCPGVAAQDVERVLGCLQSIHAARLDGRPVAGLAFDAGTDPRTERPALVAMIDVRGLPPGRHALRIASGTHDADAPADWIIPFWR